MANLVSDLIDEAFIDLGMTQPGVSVSSATQTNAFRMLNQMLLNWSAEGDTVFGKVMQTFTLVAGTSAYTLGNGGTFATTGNLRAQKVTAWLGTAGNMREGGDALAMDEFAAACVAAQASLAALYAEAATEGVVTTVPSPLVAPIPLVVGCDTAYPLINVRVFPQPSSSPGNLELAYWVPIVAFATVSDGLTGLPPGFEAAIHFNLAVELYPQYPRAGGMSEVLLSRAQNSKAALVAQNRVIANAIAK